MVTVSDPTTLTGTPVVPGMAYGPALLVSTDIPEETIRAFGDGGFAHADAAMAANDAAVDAVSSGYAAKAERASGAAAEVLTASAGLVRDKGLRGAVATNVASRPLLEALDAAINQFVDLFTAMGGLMAERATDLRDIRRRLVANLVGVPEPGLSRPDVPSVVIADDLAPSDTAGLDPQITVALVTRLGGPTSHTAIIARQLGIPCIVGTPGITEIEPGTPVLVDGTVGTVRTGVSAAEGAELVEQDRAARAEVQAWTGPAVTSDGVRVKLLANIADGPSAEKSATTPVEGVGLFRTELCFLNRTEEPSVEEQADIYAAALAPFAKAGQYVVVRTLDAGSDKPIAFATHEGEENPALGVRGLRLSFDNPGLLDRQLDGIAEAARRTGAEAWVMAPMVATVAEAQDFAAKVRARGLKPGIMIEIPSAALLAHRLLEVVDFFSIGTNDLTQYTMAADRMATDLAHLTDPWQPAALQLISLTAGAGRAEGKPVGVCGEAAADPALACVLVGLGVTSLSMAGAAVRAVGVQLGKVSAKTCVRAAEAALAADDPAAARAAVRAVLEAGDA